MSQFKKVSIVIPVYNEEKTIENIVKKVREADTLGLEKEIICVNDCSQDGSKETLEKICRPLYLYHSFHFLPFLLNAVQSASKRSSMFSKL